MAFSSFRRHKTLVPQGTVRGDLRTWKEGLRVIPGREDQHPFARRVVQIPGQATWIFFNSRRQSVAEGVNGALIVGFGGVNSELAVTGAQGSCSGHFSVKVREVSQPGR